MNKMNKINKKNYKKIKKMNAILLNEIIKFDLFLLNKNSFFLSSKINLELFLFIIK